MKISEQGFSERLPAQGRAGAIDSAGGPQGGKQSGAAAATDRLQLSSLAEQLQKASGGEAAHTAKVSALAAAVRNSTFQVDPGRISRAIVSEAVSPGGAR